MAARTVREFPANGDLQQVVEQWAQENGYRFVSTDGNARVYQHGSGFWVAPMMFSIAVNGQNARLESWIRVTTFTRAMALFMLPPEMGIESGGLKAALPRSMARNDVNKLLQRLGQPPIA